MAKKEDDDEKAIEREAKRDAKVAVKAEQTEQNNLLLEKVNRKLAKALEQAQSGPNNVQILVATTTAVTGSGVGFIVNRKIRKKLREKLWVNEKGERSMANIAVADGVPITVGTLMFVGGFFIENGPLSAAVTGLGGGLVGGTIISAATALPETP